MKNTKRIINLIFSLCLIMIFYSCSTNTVDKKKPEPKPQKPASDNNQYATQIASLVDMGFEKSQAEAAIKAARGQIDIAVDFLYNGIPEGINDDQYMEGEDDGQGEGEAEGEGEGEGEEEIDPLKQTASVAKIL